MLSCTRVYGMPKFSHKTINVISRRKKLNVTEARTDFICSYLPFIFCHDDGDAHKLAFCKFFMLKMKRCLQIKTYVICMFRFQMEFHSVKLKYKHSEREKITKNYQAFVVLFCFDITFSPFCLSIFFLSSYFFFCCCYNIMSNGVTGSKTKTMLTMLTTRHQSSSCGCMPHTTYTYIFDLTTPMKTF